MALSEQDVRYIIEKAESCLRLWLQAPNYDLTNLKEALKCYDQIIENASPHPRYYQKRADIKRILDSWESGNYLDDAIEDISKAIELDPDNGFFYSIRGRLIFTKLDKDGEEKEQLLNKIIADCKTSIEKNPSYPDVWITLMVSNILSHNWDDAISRYGSCRPYMNTMKYQLIRSWLGCTALALAGDPIEEEDKIPLSDKTVRINSDERVIEIASFIGDNYLKEKRKEKWQKVIEVQILFIDHFNRLFDKGNILYRLTYYEEALIAFNKELDISPGFYQAWKWKGNTLEKLSRYEETLKSYCKAIELDSDDAKVWYGRARIYSLLRDKKNALTNLSKAIDLDSKYKENAKKDEAFKKFWDDEDFKKFIYHFAEPPFTFNQKN